MTSEVAAAKPKEEKPAKTDAQQQAPKEAATSEEKKDKKDSDLASIPKKIAPPQPGYARPVMIHRAIYGSFERFIA
jgi:threonyl-tRNA synthetase